MECKMCSNCVHYRHRYCMRHEKQVNPLLKSCYDYKEVVNEGM